MNLKLNYPVPVSLFIDARDGFSDRRILAQMRFDYFPTEKYTVAGANEHLSYEVEDEIPSPHWRRVVSFRRPPIKSEPRLITIGQEIVKGGFAYAYDKKAGRLKASGYKATIFLESDKHPKRRDETYDLDRNFWRNPNKEHERLAMQNLRDLSIELNKLFIVRRLATWKDYMTEICAVDAYEIINQMNEIPDKESELKKAYEDEMWRRWFWGEID